MSWLTLINGVVATLDNPPEYDQAEAIVEALKQDPELAGFEVDIQSLGGLLVYPSHRKFTTTLYSPGNSDSFGDTWLGTRQFGENCQVWPFGKQAVAPNGDESAACVRAAERVREKLGGAVGVGELAYGVHVVCFD